MSLSIQDLIKAVEMAKRKIYVEVIPGIDDDLLYKKVTIIDADILLAELKKMEE